MQKSFAFALACLVSVTLAEQSPELVQADVQEVVEPTPVDDGILTIDLQKLNSLRLAVMTSVGLPVEQGASVRFAVACNPSTGYTWNVVKESSNGFFTVTNTFIQDYAPDGWTGVGGTCYFTVEAGSAPGDGIFEISHGRAWDSAEENISTYRIPIHVV